MYTYTNTTQEERLIPNVGLLGPGETSKALDLFLEESASIKRNEVHTEESELKTGEEKQESTGNPGEAAATTENPGNAAANHNQQIMRGVDKTSQKDQNDVSQ